MSLEHRTALGAPSYSAWVDGCRCSLCAHRHDRFVEGWRGARAHLRGLGWQLEPRVGCGCDRCHELYASPSTEEETSATP